MVRHHGRVQTFAFVVYDGFQLLDLAGPLEVLRTATLLGVSPGYRTLVVTPTGLPATSESGVQVAADTSLTRLRRSRSAVDTVVGVGGLGSGQVAADQRVVRDVAAVAGRARRTASVCTGTFVLAAAGLLDGRQATTHWASCDRLAEAHPEVEVLADRIYVRDGDVWTSAGVTAGIDLALALVEEDHGPTPAHQAAGWLVVFARRPGGQAQFSAQLQAQQAHTPALADLQRWLPDHLAEDLGVEALARRVAMSPRTFARTFKGETGTTPAAHVEALRVEAARRLLETTDDTVAALAAAVGFRHAETLHRVFRRRVGTTPD